MIELKHDRLVFTFPGSHPGAELSIEFQRTLRIPDDNRSYPLPPGLGAFPLRHVDDYASEVPAQWLQRGGVMMPMYQSEALWLNFDASPVQRRRSPYPFAIKVATGKQCAVSGEPWTDNLVKRPQNYMVAPEQPWLDGYVVEKGHIRQFVAMPLGAGFSAEEQLTGAAEHGGIQVAVYPMKREVFERRFPIVQESAMRARYLADADIMECAAPVSCDMGLAPGGLMNQEIYDDPFNIDDWDLAAGSRCFVHLCNSMVWQSITGSEPPHPPPTAEKYTKAGLPWFEWYDDSAIAVGATEKLKGLKSVATLSGEKATVVLPENESVTPDNIVVYRKGLQPGQVREGRF
ncbi:MAG: hypothetical protein ABGZ35_05405 [Planctomycetaceae bacterium]